MENMEHASIDMEKLADSLSGKFKTLHPLSEKCCIYRVPPPKRRVHQSHYTPQMVSIGPLHHGNPELEAMEEHKIRYMEHFLQRTKVHMARFLSLIKEKEVELRNCYAETINLESDEFTAIILVDAIFLIEYFLRIGKHDFITNDDRILGKPWLFKHIRLDLLLLENQIPLFILSDLFNLAKTATYGDCYEGLSLITIICKPLLNIFELRLPIGENMFQTHFPRAKHFLDLLNLYLQPSQPRVQSALKKQRIPSSKELHQAGVKFKSASSKNLLDITFNNGILEIPFLTVYDSTECLFRNLIAFEILHGHTRYLNDYVTIMSFLVDTQKDAEFLMQNEIIGLGKTGRFLTTFQSLIPDCEHNKNFQYSGLTADLHAYCKIPCHEWKANLKQNYFNTPWASISVIAAVILLLLTIAQTVCAIIAL